MAFFLIASPIPPYEAVLVFIPVLLLAVLPTHRLVRATSVAVAGAAAFFGVAAIWCCCGGWLCWPVLFP